MTSTMEQARDLLKTVSGDGSNLFDHVGDVLVRILQEKPDQPLDVFENLSAQVKHARLSDDRPMAAHEIDAQTHGALSSHAESVLSLFKPREASGGTGAGEEAGEEEQEEQAVGTGHVPDMLNEMQLFEWSGVDFGRQEMLAIVLGCRKLVQNTPNISSLRFFGKVLGRHADYFVAEVKLASWPAAPAKHSDRFEEPGKGANAFGYYVTNDVLSDQWTLLPYVQPEQIMASRKMRRFLTGRLRAKVSGGNPAFPGNESNLLRCQIARISAATVISPAGFYVQPDEEDPSSIEPATEEYSPPNADLLSSGAGWSHHHAHLRLEGRAVKFQKAGGEDEDEDANKDEEAAVQSAEELEEKVALLRTVDQDRQGDAPCWAFRSSDNRTPDTTVCSAHSFSWPGAVTVCKAKTVQFASIYCGWATRWLPDDYTPPANQDIVPEWNEFVEVEQETQDDAEAQKKLVSRLIEQVDELPPTEAEVKADEAKEGEDEDAEPKDEEDFD